MVWRPPNSVFKRLLNGEFKLGPQHLEPRLRPWGKLPPLFPEQRLAKLRLKLLAAGMDPQSAGIPPPPSISVTISAPPPITYTDACKEIRYEFVKRQMEQMPKTIEDWRVVVHINSNLLFTWYCLDSKGGTQDKLDKKIAVLKSATQRPITPNQFINKVGV